MGVSNVESVALRPIRQIQQVIVVVLVPSDITYFIHQDTALNVINVHGA